MKKLLLALSLLLASCSSTIMTKADHEAGAENYDIVIYGGGAQAVATATQASNVSDGKKIALIVPESKLGSVQTVGAQNFWDTIHDDKQQFPQAGSFLKYMTATSQFYSPNMYATILANELKGHKNITIHYETDITSVTTVADTHWKQETNQAPKSNKVTHVSVDKLKKDGNNHYIFSGTPRVISGDIFVDASETGRLVRLSDGWQGSVGREDQIDATQMASTLMFKVRNINPFIQPHIITNQNTVGTWGGYEVNDLKIFKDYKASPHRYKIKPFNMAQDGVDSSEYWVNMLLVHNVDATKSWRDGDRGSDVPEMALDEAVAEISKPDFINRLRLIKGFENIELVYNDGKPVVGDMLYLRESVHTMNREGKFALNRSEAENGGKEYFDRRIGLGYYWFDNNGYTKQESHPLPLAKEPWYVPYEALVSPKLSNVLIPGYAANIDSFTWTAMRVYPNLLVLGDAAGIASGLSANGQFNILYPTESQVKCLQENLRKIGARLDK